MSYTFQIVPGKTKFTDEDFWNAVGVGKKKEISEFALFPGTFDGMDCFRYEDADFKTTQAVIKTALALGARVIGDDGEEYRIENGKLLDNRPQASASKGLPTWALILFIILVVVGMFVGFSFFVKFFRDVTYSIVGFVLGVAMVVLTWRGRNNYSSWKSIAFPLAGYLVLVSAIGGLVGLMRRST